MEIEDRETTSPCPYGTPVGQLVRCAVVGGLVRADVLCAACAAEQPDPERRGQEPVPEVLAGIRQPQGLGDVLAGAAAAVGFHECGGCGWRRAAFNWIRVGPNRSSEKKS